MFDGALVCGVSEEIILEGVSSCQDILLDNS